jgi:hypothetical protein
MNTDSRVEDWRESRVASQFDALDRVRARVKEKGSLGLIQPLRTL